MNDESPLKCLLFDITAEFVWSLLFMQFSKILLCSVEFYKAQELWALVRNLNSNVASTKPLEQLLFSTSKDNCYKLQISFYFRSDVNLYIFMACQWPNGHLKLHSKHLSTKV